MNSLRTIKTMQTYLRQREANLRFGQVQDPRDPRGQRWTLSALLSGGLVGMALLAPSLRATEKLTEGLEGTKFLKRLGIDRRIPDSTLGEVLATVQPGELREQLHRQVRREHRRKALRPERLPVGGLAVDGKTPAVLDEPSHASFCQRQGGGDHGSAKFHYRVLNATLVSSRATVCVHQMPIEASTNEMGSFRSFFEGIRKAYARCDLFEVVTSDAGVISREHAGWLHQLGFGYVVALKDNNPELELEARGVLQDLAEHEPPAASDPGFELDSSRGWVKRQVWTSTKLESWPGWEHLRQVWLVRVWRKRHDNAPVEHIEDRVYATNLPASHKLRGKHILGVVRSHWRIENELHGTLDVHMREDDPWWVRRGHGLVNSGLLRVMAYNLLAIGRAIHLRRTELLSWQSLRDMLRDAMLTFELPLTRHDDYAPG